eukprot:TRINITY_DN4829_c1_g1_i3.p1 TRINITY_DN4829_c1_g1~~TRINITY_DN4829_c1_g1_i3.p1  ORF type:complete len:132 (-),score=6.46 TRINITY_DN4829_c1_g1_i3:27-422(-)
MATTCDICSKRVYLLEKISYNQTIFHEQCLRCSVCRTRLSPYKLNVMNNIYYCQADYQRILMSKGSFDSFSDNVEEGLFTVIPTDLYIPIARYLDKRDVGRMAIVNSRFQSYFSGELVPKLVFILVLNIII